MKKNNHRILALKYRPKSFRELIGQDIMVQTITNSIKIDKLPNAYLLTGIRGVGKTTTARLIAKAINCKKNFINDENCNEGEYCHCDEISKSKHLDVLEMDAASRTGIDDIRELIESSKYNPTNAKYKIFIIDEVHMLSKQAFNGLLKTLEEPPPHLKFIFATTEVKKIPVTIISRCQRFDLHRVSIKIILNNLKRILELENGKITEGGLQLIAKSAEGSVRDSLSLLDRALVSQNIEKKEIDEIFIRKMLGIADRSKMIELLKSIFNGDQKKSIDQLREMVNEGIEPASFLNDFLEIVYFILQKKNLGDFETDLTISESELKIINSISKEIEVSTLIVFWQFILKVIDELTIVANPILSLEMLIMRLIHLKDMPSYESILSSIDKGGPNKDKSDTTNSEELKLNLDEKKKINEVSKDQIKNITQTKPELALSNQVKLNNNIKVYKILCFEDLIRVSTLKKEIELKYELEKNVNLIKFTEGKIDIGFNVNLGKNFVRKISEKLLEWTGKRWVITLTKGVGQKSYSELQLENKKNFLEKERSSNIYKKIKKVFSDAELIDVLKKD